MHTASERRPRLPEQPIDRLIGPLERFMHVEAAAGIVLLACTAIALVLANSPLSATYLHFWETEVGFHLGSVRVSHTLHHWINDGLMALFFFVVGLEVKRELVLGELRDPQRAALPVVAAIGGMLAPAAIYLAFQAGTPAQRGWGIPMATDIAFVVGCMAVLGSRIPHGLRIMILTLAIADDIGTILVIALGYSTGIHLVPLLVGAFDLVLVVMLAYVGIRSFGIYTLVGLLVWFAFQESGVHATVAGVILGLLTPARPHLTRASFARFLEHAAERRPPSDGATDAGDRSASVRMLRQAARETVSPLEYLESTLHPWVGFVIMPVFALANAGVTLHIASFTEPVAVAVAAGLLIGKPLGIVLFSWIAVRVGLAHLPAGVGWTALAGGGILAGIGFTMALFVAGLALDGTALEAAKVGIIAGSAVSAALGLAVLVRVLPASAGRSTARS
jgi:NhaA family Na+:H+ antiporter